MEKARRERNRALIVPREHGAWGLAAGSHGHGGRSGVSPKHERVPLCSAAHRSAGIVLAENSSGKPAGNFGDARRNQRGTQFSGVSWSLSRDRGRAGIEHAAVGRAESASLVDWRCGWRCLSSRKHCYAKMGRRTRMLSEIVGTIGLTASAPAVYYVITGKFGVTAWMLWLANLNFAGNQIHYVQIRIHTRQAHRRARQARAHWSFAARTVGDGGGAGCHVPARAGCLG